MIDQLLSFITAAAWALFLAAVVLYAIVNTRRYGPVSTLLRLFSLRFIAPLLVVLVISYLNWSLVFIQPQEVGVIISILSARGYRDQPFQSGLHWIVPLAEKVVVYPISWQTYTMSATPTEGQQVGDDSIAARTSDGQQVNIDCSVIFRIDPEQVVRVHIDWQDRYTQDFVRPEVRGIVRTEVSQYKVDEINSSKRRDLETDLDKQVRAAFEEKGLTLDRFILRNIGFSPEYAAAVEAKQVALQGSIQKGYEADQVRQLAGGEADRIKIEAQAQADARLVQAQAEAQALQMVSGALKQNPNLVTYEYVQKLAPDVRVMLVPNNAPYLLPLPDMSVTGTLTTTLPITNSLALPAPGAPITTTIPLTPTTSITTTVPSQ